LSSSNSNINPRFIGFFIVLLLPALLVAGCSIAGLQKDQDTAATGPLEILEQNSFGSEDQIVMQGVVRNNSDEIIDVAVVRGNAYDEEGEVIGSGTDELKQIGAGEKVPFEIVIDPDLDGLGSIQWHCTAQLE
jgi:hypothetical protein